MPKIGVEEKGVDFGGIDLGVGGGKDVGYGEGEAIKKPVNNFKEGGGGCGDRLKVCN